MSPPQESGDVSQQQSSEAACPLPSRQQTINLLRYALHMSLIYLAAPVMYVGSLDAVLLDKLGYSNQYANLPAAAFMWTTAPFLVLFTWYFCRVRMLKPVLIGAYATMAGAGLIVVAGLLQSEPKWILAALVAHAMLVGWANGVANTFEWEILSRGVAEHRRGLALGLAFGAGPILAVLSSLGTQLVLDGKLGPIAVAKPNYPWDFFTLLIASVLIMLVPAISATRYVIPLPSEKDEVAREPLVSGVFGGLGDFLGNRLLMLTTVGFMLVMLGNTTILPSVVLYTKQVLGAEPQVYAGYQFALRFAFKMVIGLLLGWLLVRTHPRAGLLATASLSLAGVLWALLVPGKWYLVCFGILGAGELYGVYYPNYLITCSPKSRVRRNLAYSQLVALPVSLAPIVFGKISDHFGLTCSIELAAALLVVAILLVQLALPRRPNATGDGGSASDAG